MPSEVSLYAFGVWFCVGLATGLGWTLGAVVIGRVLR